MSKFFLGLLALLAAVSFTAAFTVGPYDGYIRVSKSEAQQWVSGCRANPVSCTGDYVRLLDPSSNELIEYQFHPKHWTELDFKIYYYEDYKLIHSIKKR